MARSIWQKTITDDQGNIQEGVQITVNIQGGGLADISANQSGSVSKDNPFLTGVDGVAKFFAEPGFYKVSVFKNGDTAEFQWNNVGDNRFREDIAEPDSSVIIGGVGLKKRAIHVDTVADAKALNAPIGTKVVTAGYNSVGDGGGNDYIVVAGGTGTDDGGLFIDMDNGNQLEALDQRSFNILQYGIKADGTDETLQFQSAVDSQVELDGLGLTVKIANEIRYDDDFKINNINIDATSIEGNFSVIRPNGRFGEGVDVFLTADCEKSETVSVDTSSFSVGDKVIIESDDWWYQAQSIYISEIKEIISINSISQMTLDGKTKFNYLTADNARLRKLTLCKGFNIEDFSINGSGAGDSLTLFDIAYCLKPQIKGVYKSSNAAWRHIALRRCVEPNFDASFKLDVSTNINANAYGIGIVGCVGGYIRHVFGRDMRHTITFGGTDVSHDFTVDTLMATEYISSPFDCHAAACDITVNSVVGYGPKFNTGQNALDLQGVNITINSFDVDGLGSNHGMFFQPQVDYQDDWFCRITGQARNVDGASSFVQTIGLATISSVELDMNSSSDSNEQSLYVYALNGDIENVSARGRFRGGSNSNDSIFVRSTPDATVKNTNLDVITEQQNSAVDNIYLLGDVANPLGVFSIKGIVRGGNIGLRAVNCGEINSVGVVYIGCSTNESIT